MLVYREWSVEVAYFVDELLLAEAEQETSERGIVRVDLQVARPHSDQTTNVGVDADAAVVDDL